MAGVDAGFLQADAEFDGTAQATAVFFQGHGQGSLRGEVAGKSSSCQPVTGVSTGSPAKNACRFFSTSCTVSRAASGD
ncbi:hypothetical protein D3C76_1781720 [compost metagenome]